jgi:hypothetical protein
MTLIVAALFGIITSWRWFQQDTLKGPARSMLLIALVALLLGVIGL